MIQKEYDMYFSTFSGNGASLFRTLDERGCDVQPSFSSLGVSRKNLKLIVNQPTNHDNLLVTNPLLPINDAEAVEKKPEELSKVLNLATVQSKWHVNTQLVFCKYFVTLIYFKRWKWWQKGGFNQWWLWKSWWWWVLPIGKSRRGQNQNYSHQTRKWWKAQVKLSSKRFEWAKTQKKSKFISFVWWLNEYKVFKYTFFEFISIWLSILQSIGKGYHHHHALRFGDHSLKYKQQAQLNTKEESLPQWLAQLG